MSRRKCITLVILAGLGGFLAGSLSHWPTVGPVSDVARLALAHQAAAPQPNQVHTGASKASTSGEDSWSLPRSLLLKLWPSPLINYRLGKFEPMSLLKYGLDFEQSIALVKAVNENIDQLFQLELDNSKLITDKQGNQYIVIETFQEGGQVLKDRIRQIVLDACKNFPDQRGELLAESLLRNSVFSSFGQFRRELAIEEEVKGDTKKYVLKIRARVSTNIRDEKSIEMTGNYESDHFQELVRKHIPSKGP